jgi:hypothetical protein
MKTLTQGHCPNPFIKLDKKPTGNSGSVLTYNHGFPQSTVLDLRCEVCLFWIEKYYTDVPSLQAKIKAFTAQIDSLTTENHRLKPMHKDQGNV